MDLSGPQGELPIPMHATSSYAASAHVHGGGGHSGTHALLHHDHHHPTNGPEPPEQAPPTQQHSHAIPSPVVAEDSKKRLTAGIGVNAPAAAAAAAVKYRECLKNHAAAIGGNATDGCGEFMPSGEEGSLEALKCSACGCHRNFHRKELDGAGDACDCTHLKGRRLIGQLGPLSPMAQKGLLVAGPPPPGSDPFGFSARALPPPPHAHHHMIMPLSAMQTSESDEMDAVGGCAGSARAPMTKKRFRTKFTPEQKEKMLSFAEKVGWRLQKLEDSVVQQFCQEIGVKRRVLKVWMHNNKHNLAAKKPGSPPLQLE